MGEETNRRSHHQRWVSRLVRGFFGAFGGKGSAPSGLQENLIVRVELAEFDLIAVGRVLISDSHRVDKVREGRTQELLGFKAADLAALA